MSTNVALELKKLAEQSKQLVAHIPNKNLLIQRNVEQLDSGLFYLII